jgi:regulator of protease activity HflC (stomatin/prohibitin superfamily)
MKKTTTTVALALIAMILGAGCASQAPVDEIGLYYTGGPVQGKHFKRVINPGSGSTFLGFGDDVKWLPAGQRNYIVSKKTDEGDRKVADFIRVPARGGVNMDFEVSVYFRLNTHTGDIEGYKGGTLRRFWEAIGKKYSADSEKGWDAMLNDNFRKIIETSMRQKVFTFTVDELYANAEGAASGREDAILKIQNEIASALKDNINTTLGGEFFCGPTFDAIKPECPPFQFIINSAEPTDQGVRESFSAQRVAANQVITAQNQAQARKAEADGTAAVKAAEAKGIVEAQNALRGNLSGEFLELQRIEALKACATRQGCTLIIGGGVTPTLPVG